MIDAITEESMGGATSQTNFRRPPIPAGTEQGTAKAPCCGLCNRAAVTSPTFTRQSLRVRLSAVTGTLLSSLCYGEDKFIRNRGR